MVNQEQMVTYQEESDVNQEEIETIAEHWQVPNKEEAVQNQSTG
jgi:hypothetical protein